MPGKNENQQVDWTKALKPLIKKYKSRKHPLDYQNTYQLLVVVVLSAQDSDNHINAIAPELFKAFPTMQSLSKATPEKLFPYIGKVRSSAKKAEWLIKIAQEIKRDSNIPLSMDELVKLPGIGRKSANVIKRESGAQAEGIMVDLHVVRVVPRLGVVNSEDPKKIEQELMKILPQKDWGEVGMALSFLGRETCRPSHPKHDDCVMKSVCAFYKQQHS